MVAPLMPKPATTGRPWARLIRLVLDGIQYVLRTRCAWAHLPHEFLPHQTVLRWFLRLSRSDTFEAIARVLAALDRALAGQDPPLMVAVIDAQAARSGSVGVAGQRGYDPALRVTGRKRHALVGTDGRLHLARVPARQPRRHHPAQGVPRILARPQALLRRLGLCRCARGGRDRHRRHAGPRRTRPERLCSPAPPLDRRAQPSHAGRCRRLARD